MTNKEISKEIINQLGGINKLNSMLGLKNILIIDNGLYIRYKVSSPANYIKIQLNKSDLYEIEIGKIMGIRYKVILKLSDVYVDKLKNIIEETCKVRLSLF